MANSQKVQTAEKNASTTRKPVAPDENRDPLTGEPGAHPLGVGVGAAAGGAAAGVLAGAMAGAAGGTAAGPIGTAVGAVIGAVAGGLAGKGIAESIDPTSEDAYWRENYQGRAYVSEGSTYDEYRPAYQYGWESRIHSPYGTFDEFETDLAKGWDKHEHSQNLAWDRARGAARDAWNRIDERTRQGAEPSAAVPETWDAKKS